MTRSTFELLAEAISSHTNDLSNAERKALKAILGLQIPYPNYSTLVNYEVDIPRLVERGNYHSINHDITNQHFPVIKWGIEHIEIFLIDLDRRMSNSEVNLFLNSFDLRDADIRELLSLGAQYPDLQRQSDIAARGSYWVCPESIPMIPYLRCVDSQRSLELTTGVDSGHHWQVAAVKK